LYFFICIALYYSHYILYRLIFISCEIYNLYKKKEFTILFFKICSTVM